MRLDDNELGLKDTVRVNPNEVVDIAVRFESYAGPWPLPVAMIHAR